LKNQHRLESAGDVQADKTPAHPLLPAFHKKRIEIPLNSRALRAAGAQGCDIISLFNSDSQSTRFISCGRIELQANRGVTS
jgi:hypothetical protein